MRKEVSIVLAKPPEVGADAAAAASPGQPAEPPYTIVNHGEVQVTFRSKAIVLSNGGQ